MREAGLNAARIGEFAWSRIEPWEGPYGKGLAIIEIQNQPGQLAIESPATDLPAGRKLRGKIEVKAYEVLMIVNKK